MRPELSLSPHGTIEHPADLILLLSVSLPPAALDILGPLVAEETVDTPFGQVGPLGLRAADGRPAVWVEPYSGSPARTDPRATILAAAQLGLRQIFAWDSGIGLNPEVARGQVLIVSDYIDWTRGRQNTFAGAETSLEQIAGTAQRPAFCPRMTEALRHTLPEAAEVIYLAVDGPRRETPAEARMFRSWGADVIGQNLAPEVSLAQEAGFCFAGLVTVAELGADRQPAEAHGEMRASLGSALAALPAFIERVSKPGACTCAATIGGYNNG